jgi:hypothetical protein
VLSQPAGGVLNRESYVRGTRATARRIIAITGAAVLCFSQVAKAQVGLTSGPAQVTLMARRSPQGSLPAVGIARELNRSGSVRETLTTVRIVANAGYRLVVRRAPSAQSRVWVRSADGEFQEVSRDSAVTVDQGGRGGGERESQIHFRVDGPGTDNIPGQPPVFYDLVMNPTL